MINQAQGINEILAIAKKGIAFDWKAHTIKVGNGKIKLFFTVPTDITADKLFKKLDKLFGIDLRRTGDNGVNALQAVCQCFDSKPWEKVSQHFIIYDGEKIPECKQDCQQGSKIKLRDIDSVAQKYTAESFGFRQKNQKWFDEEFNHSKVFTPKERARYHIDYINRNPAVTALEFRVAQLEKLGKMFVKLISTKNDKDRDNYLCDIFMHKDNEGKTLVDYIIKHEIPRSFLSSFRDIISNCLTRSKESIENMPFNNNSLSDKKLKLFIRNLRFAAELWRVQSFRTDKNFVKLFEAFTSFFDRLIQNSNADNQLIFKLLNEILQLSEVKYRKDLIAKFFGRLEQAPHISDLFKQWLGPDLTKSLLVKLMQVLEPSVYIPYLMTLKNKMSPNDYQQLMTSGIGMTPKLALLEAGIFEEEKHAFDDIVSMASAYYDSRKPIVGDPIKRSYVYYAFTHNKPKSGMTLLNASPSDDCLKLVTDSDPDDGKRSVLQFLLDDASKRNNNESKTYFELLIVKSRLKERGIEEKDPEIQQAFIKKYTLPLMYSVFHAKDQQLIKYVYDLIPPECNRLALLDNRFCESLLRQGTYEAIIFFSSTLSEADLSYFYSQWQAHKKYLVNNPNFVAGTNTVFTEVGKYTVIFDLVAYVLEKKGQNKEEEKLIKILSDVINNNTIGTLNPLVFSEQAQCLVQRLSACIKENNISLLKGQLFEALNYFNGHKGMCNLLNNVQPVDDSLQIEFKEVTQTSDPDDISSGFVHVSIERSGIDLEYAPSAPLELSSDIPPPEYSEEPGDNQQNSGQHFQYPFRCQRFNQGDGADQQESDVFKLQSRHKRFSSV